MRARSRSPRRSARKFQAPERQREIGDLKIKISGCINACGHHHVGHIGILGVEKKGTELYQISVGGDATENAAIGDILAMASSPRTCRMPSSGWSRPTSRRRESADEPFIAAYRRIGDAPFKEALYGKLDSLAASRRATSRTSSARSASWRSTACSTRWTASACCARPSPTCCPATSPSSRRSARTRRCCCTWCRRSITTLPVYFLETGKHFPETLDYVATLEKHLGLTNVRWLRPDPKDIARFDPNGDLWETDPDSCCHIRKTEPLDAEIAQFGGWVTGRKRYQTTERGVLPHFELTSDDRIKVNPLAYFSDADVNAYKLEHGLARASAVR